jgi:hypothetical protein
MRTSVLLTARASQLVKHRLQFHLQLAAAAAAAIVVSFPRENGPLEAGWGIAAMARALELVRSQDTSGVISSFLTWVNRYPMQDMLYYTVDLTSKNLPNTWGNCECRV